MARRHIPAPGQLSLFAHPDVEPVAPAPIVAGCAAPVCPTECRVIVPVEPTFDVSQGIREVMTAYDGADSLTVTFDARHLELAEHSGGTALYDPLEPYIVGGRHRPTAGLVNPATFLNILRCMGAIEGWFQSNQGRRPDFGAVAPSAGTKALALWETIRIGEVIERLGRPAPLTHFPVMGFGSGFISPALVVTEKNRQPTIQAIQGWVSTIEGRLGALAPTMIRYVPEIVMNLVNHNHIKGGGLIIAVWPSGQAELLWCNRVDGLKDWPSEDSPEGVANSLLYHNKGGDGIGYIFRELLPRYRGVLIVNYKGSDVAFFAGEKCDIYGRNPRSPQFLPRSILFTLQLFSDETRQRST